MGYAPKDWHDLYSIKKCWPDGQWCTLARGDTRLDLGIGLPPHMYPIRPDVHEVEMLRDGNGWMENYGLGPGERGWPFS